MKTASFALMMFFLLLSFNVVPAYPAEIVSVTQDRDEVPRFHMVEISIDLDRLYDNPYDPEEVRVSAEMTAPSGDPLTVNGFWFEPYVRSLEGDTEVFTPDGPGGWRVRFAPLLQGVHTYRILVEDPEGQTLSAPFSFTALAAQSRGFIRVDGQNPRYFMYDDGTSYVPLGVSICWVTDASGGFRYTGYLDSLAGGGGNWTRLWMSHFGQGTALEWGAYHHTGYYDGLGRYSQQVGTRLDAVFRHAEQLGVAIALVLHQHSQLETIQWSSWDENPYNAANGGPCPASEDYLTDPEAIRLAENLHRYIVARYGAFRSVMAWEIWNEADSILGVPMPSMNAWSRNAAARIRGIDPAGHLVTTSYGAPIHLAHFDIETWDFNNRHQYVFGSWLVGGLLRPYREANRPLLLSEFGIDWWAALNDQDPLGVNIHNGTWSALMHGYAGGAMNWWWDSYIDPQDLWFLNRAPADFVAGEQMTAFTVDVPAFAVGDGRLLEIAGIGAFGGDGGTRIWFWVHDPESAWWTRPEQILPLDDAVAVLLTDVPSGPRTCLAEVWDTWTGEILETFPVQQTLSILPLDLPSFTRDMAVKLACP